MTTTTIAIVVAVVLLVLFAAAYTVQALERARSRKRQMEFALRKRIARLSALIEVFPAGFLTKDLAQLISRGLVDAWEQLSALERGNTTYSEGLTNASKQLEAIRSGAASHQGGAAPQNAQQFNDLERYLGVLQKLVSSLSQKGNMTPEEERLLSSQIKMLTVRANLGQHRFNADEAKSQNKPRLAAHHLQLAVNTLKKANSAHFQGDLAELQDQIMQLEALARQQDDQLHTLPSESEAVSKEWDSFSAHAKEDPWKKKAIYD